MVTVYKLDQLPPIPAPVYRLVRCLNLLERRFERDLNDAAVVDVGCNLGQLCYHIKERFPRCGGVLLWGSHDTSPLPINTSIVDYHGRPKPAAMALKEVWRAGRPAEARIAS